MCPMNHPLSVGAQVMTRDSILDAHPKEWGVVLDAYQWAAGITSYIVRFMNGTETFYFENEITQVAEPQHLADAVQRSAPFHLQTSPDAESPAELQPNPLVEDQPEWEVFDAGLALVLAELEHQAEAED